jgi:ribosomal protein S18 acetylase RimI-like enzyme
MADPAAADCGWTSVPADVAVRRADPAEADLVGEMTERVYRDGGFGSGAYAEVRMLAVDEADRGHGIAGRLMAACETLARDQGLAAVILCTETRMQAAQRLYERRGYLRQPARDWQIRNVSLIAYRLPL